MVVELIDALSQPAPKLGETLTASGKEPLLAVSDLVWAGGALPFTWALNAMAVDAAVRTGLALTLRVTLTCARELAPKTANMATVPE